jgi:hypothetical protein
MHTYLNPRIVRPTGENAAAQAKRLGPADATVLHAAAALLYDNEQLVFGQVQAHRLRLLAQQMEQGTEGAPTAHTKSPGKIGAVITTLQHRRDTGTPISGEELDLIIAVLRAYDGALGKALTSAAEWANTAEGIQNLLEEDRAKSRAYQDQLVRTVASLAADAERAERACPGIEQRVAFVVVAGGCAGGDGGDDGGAIDPHTATALALALLDGDEVAA